MKTNEFSIIGNLGQKPELKTGKNDKSYLQFSVAVNEKYTPKGSTEPVEKTNWFSLVVFDKKAEELAKVLDRGTRVLVKGKLETRVEEVDGKKFTRIELRAFQVEVQERNAPAAEPQSED